MPVTGRTEERFGKNVWKNPRGCGQGGTRAKFFRKKAIKYIIRILKHIKVYE